MVYGSGFASRCRHACHATAHQYARLHVNLSIASSNAMATLPLLVRQKGHCCIDRLGVYHRPRHKCTRHVGDISGNAGCSQRSARHQCWQGWGMGNIPGQGRQEWLGLATMAAYTNIPCLVRCTFRNQSVICRLPAFTGNYNTHVNHNAQW